MARLLFRYAAAAAMLLAAAPAAAQESASEDPAIVVTGERPTHLVLDVERIARRCIACRRALDRLRAVARRQQAPTARMSADGDGPLHGEEWGRGVRPLEVAGDMHRQALRAQRDANARAGRLLDRRETSDDAARFTANLLRLVEPIAERIRAERGAEGVYGAGDPAARGRALTDITADVIEALDRDHHGADLLEETP